MKVIQYPIITICLVFSFLFSCNSTKNLKETGNFPVGIHDIWALDEMHELEANGGAIIPFAVLNNHPMIEINTTQMKSFGNDGCNEFQTSIEKLSQEEINFGPIGGTKKMCPNMKISNTYSRLLGEVAFFKLKGTTLLLLDENKKAILQFRKVD